MTWTNQGGFPLGQSGGTITNVTTTINNFENAAVNTYPTYIDLITAAPLADEIGIVASNSGDGYEGTSWFWDVATAQWRSAANPTTVNGVTGPIITLDADDIAPSGTRLWLTSEQATQINGNSAAIADLTPRVVSLETSKVQLEADIATLTTAQNTTAGNLAALLPRVVTAEDEIDALQALTASTSTAITSLTATQTTQGTAIAGIQGSLAGLTPRVAALEVADVTITARLDAIDALDATQTTRIDGVVTVNTTQDGRLNSLESSRTITDNNVTALTARVTATEGVNTTQTGQINTINTTLSGLPGVYQVRSEKNQPGGYVGLRADGTIDPNILPPTVQPFREIIPVGTIAERDALAANDPRPEIDGPWGEAQAGLGVLVAETGSGAGFFIWNGSTFLDFTGSLVITSSDDVTEGSINLFFTNARVANAPAVVANTSAIAALNISQAAQDARMDGIDSDLIALGGRMNTAENNIATNTGAIATNTGNIATNTAAIATNTAAIATLTGSQAVQDTAIATLQSQNVAQDAAIAARLTSFNGRTGPAITPAPGDYTNAQTTNVATKVAGAFTSNALDNLKDAIDAVAATAGPVTNKVTKGGDAGAFSAGTTDATNLTLIANNAPRIVLNGTSGLTEIKGLTEAIAATGTVTVNPTTGALHIDPNVRVPLGWVDGCEVSFPSSTSVAVAPGQMEIGGRLITVQNSITKNAALAWVAGTGAGGQIGTWGNGSQYVYVGYNTSTAAVDVFVSNSANVTTSNGFTLKLLIPLYVESSAIKTLTHFSKLRRAVYDTDWSTNINPVTTAGGALIPVGVPVYPLLMSIYCSPGAGIDSNTVSVRFSRNSANSTPSITQPASWIAGFDGDTSTSNLAGRFDTPASLELVTNSAQLRAIRSGTYSSGPTLHIKSYSW